MFHYSLSSCFCMVLLTVCHVSRVMVFTCMWFIAYHGVSTPWPFYNVFSVHLLFVQCIAFCAVIGNAFPFCAIQVLTLVVWFLTSVFFEIVGTVILILISEFIPFSRFSIAVLPVPRDSRTLKVVECCQLYHQQDIEATVYFDCGPSFYQVGSLELWHYFVASLLPFNCISVCGGTVLYCTGSLQFAHYMRTCLYSVYWVF